MEKVLKFSLQIFQVLDCLVLFWVVGHRRIAGGNDRICRLIIGAWGCCTSQVVATVGVVDFIVGVLINVVVVFVISGIVAVCMVVDVVVVLIVIVINVGRCSIVVIDVAFVISRCAEGGGAVRGRRRINSLCRASNSDEKAGMGLGSLIAGESLLSALRAVVMEAYGSSLVLRVETPNKFAICR